MPSYAHLTDYLQANSEKLGKKAALVTDTKTLDWQQLQRQSEVVGQNLTKRLGSDKQQVVALLMPNTWEFVVAYLGILQAGHIAMPIDVIYKPLEIEAVLHQIPPRLLIADEAGRARITTDIPVLGLDDLSSPLNEKIEPLRLAPDKQIATLLFTSGTTGQPKAVPYTHAIHAWNIDVCSQVWEWTSEDSQLISLRLSHMYGLVMGLSGTIYHGNTMYLQDGFDAATTLKLLASGKVSIFTHGPLVYAKLLETPNPESYDLSKVRLFISGSGPLAPSIWQSFKDVFGHEILEVYGTTETGRIASNLLNERIPGSPGRPLPGVKLKTDAKDQVMIKSGGVISGYWNNKDATAEARTSDGFWKTGDFGELKNGRLILKGRLQERIRRQGYTVSPRDVEWALLTNTQIKEAIVVGVQQPGQPNDKLVYFLRTTLSDEQVAKFCAQALPSVWRPDKVIKLPQIPRTRSGKANLHALKEML
ncbi:MAG TPA: class I adenylate-forming enzyme family protein [Candidatus Binatia bacterium]|nr:class I adenylate-forming enzyme family protein [Candidatus Binatia bacterium]